MYFTLGMPNPYDESLRHRVIRAYEAGEGTYDELAALFALGARTIQRWVVRFRAEGTVVALPKGGGWRSPIQVPLLHTLIAEAPDATCAELCWAYNRRAPAAGVFFEHVSRAAHRAPQARGRRLVRGRARSTGPTSNASAPRTGAGADRSIPAVSSSSMKPARTSRWAARTPGSRRGTSTWRRGR
jgi:transposase